MPAFQGLRSWSSRLALLAALLIAVMPTISRIAGSAAHGDGAGWAEVCTVGGLKFVKADGDGRPQGAPLHVSADGDCAYCPLATSLILPALVLALVPQLAPPSPPPATPAAWWSGNAHPATLGSRGPPAPL